MFAGSKGPALHIHGLIGSAKADLAIYSHMLGVSEYCYSAALMLSYKLDFSSCAIRDSCWKSSHIHCNPDYMHVYEDDLCWD